LLVVSSIHDLSDLGGEDTGHLTIQALDWSARLIHNGCALVKQSFSSTDRSFAEELDRRDVLSSYRSAFVSSEPGLIYLNGNSLGRLPVATSEALESTVEEAWGKGLIRSWREEWYDLPAKAGNRIAKLIGAQPGEVIVSDSTTINLYKLTIAALEAQTGRTGIVTDEMNFPSDQYVLQAVAARLKAKPTITYVKSHDGVSISTEHLSEAIDTDTALVCLSHVNYKTGFLYDMEVVTQIARDAGAMTLWDLSHSVGVIPIDLAACGADLAVGCTYKYLNGGPGAPAFLYVREALQGPIDNPIWGWFGAEQPFSFDSRFTPSKGIRRYLVGTPPIVSMQTIPPAVDLTLEAGVERIRHKSILLTEYMLYLSGQLLAPLGFTTASPSEPSQRGSHITLRHTESYRISRALLDTAGKDPVVVTDFREPDLLRLGAAPLYNTFAEVHAAITRIRVVAADRLYESQSPQREKVT